LVKKAVLFDVDGTLLDTYEFIVQAYEHVAAHEGRPLSREAAIMYVSIGATLRETYAMMMPDKDIHHLVGAHRDFQGKNMHLVTLYPGVEETLKKLKETGVKLATVTNRFRDSSLETLAHTGVKDYFDVLVCADDVLRPKPDPEHAFAALRALSVDTQDAVLVGDSQADIECGKHAGIMTVGVSYGVHDDIASRKPDHVIHSIQELLPLVLA
jgi:pyrophosphatase PpaX